MLSSVIEHTLLHVQAGDDAIVALCKEAEEHHFFGVCVAPRFIPLARKHLPSCKLISVIGFPCGFTDTATKCFEAKTAYQAGANELDIVLPINLLKTPGTNSILLSEMRMIQQAAPCPLKVIIETALLTDDEKKRICHLADEAGMAFIKTSTGFHAGATIHDIALIRAHSTAGIKASGGIRTRAQAESMLAAGATRIGTGSAMAIIQEAS